MSIEKLIIRRLRAHYRSVTKHDKPDKEAFANGNTGRHEDGSCWHMGWRSGFQAAMTLIQSGYATASPKEMAARRRAAMRYVKRIVGEQDKPAARRKGEK